MQDAIQESQTESAWAQLAPVLDEAIAQLGTKIATPSFCVISKTRVCAMLARSLGGKMNMPRKSELCARAGEAASYLRQTSGRSRLRP